MGAGSVRERPGRCLPHTSLMTKLASAFTLRRETQRTIHEHRRNDHDASGSFICRESFSVYSRGMATMATMATPKLNLEK